MCIENGCRSDADCFNDQICKKKKWGSTTTCESREDCRTKGCDTGRFCVGLKNYHTDECRPCEQHSQDYCSIEAAEREMVDWYMDLDITHRDGTPWTEEEKREFRDRLANQPGLKLTVDSCQSVCMAGTGTNRTPTPTAEPTLPPTPLPTPHPTPQPTPYFQRGGDGFLEFGNWRVGVSRDGEYFSFCHASEGLLNGYKTAIAFNKDGTQLYGGDARLPANACRWFQLDNELTPRNVLYGWDWIQFGVKWRLGATDDFHASVSYQDGSVDNGSTAMIWRWDGVRVAGPAGSFSSWTSTHARTVTPNIRYGHNFIQFGNFRMGEMDGHHFSIWNVNTRKTAVIYRSDGTVHPGPRDDFNQDNPVMGELESWNKFRARAAFDEPKVCQTRAYISKCSAFICPRASDCEDGPLLPPNMMAKNKGKYDHAEKVGSEYCGFLGCRLKCEAKWYDYGCGCKVKPDNLNGLEICRTA